MRNSCVVFLSMSFILNLSAETTRIWAVNAGSATRYGDFAGDTNTDGWYEVGGVSNLGVLTNPAPAEVYQWLKYNATSFSYTLLPLQPNGRYTLRLHFNEKWNNHQFTVSANGTQIQSAFNPYLAAGSQYYYAVIREYPVQAASDGKISLAFTASGGGCAVNGIEVVEEATNNPARPVASCWPQRVPGSVSATYKTAVRLLWPEQVYGNLLTNVFTVFRSTNETASFTAVAAVTNATSYLDTDTLPGLTNRYFVKRGALSGTFARTLETNEYASIALPLADNYVIPYRRVWAVNCGYTNVNAAFGEFAPDTQYSGTGSQGVATANTITLPNTLDFPAPVSVYKSARYNSASTNVDYTFPVLTNRHYRLRLHFCEAWATPRKFNIAVNGRRVASDFDVSSVAGGMDRATILDCECAPDTNSQLRVSITKGSNNNPMVNGIELVEFYYAPPLAAGELPVTVSNTWEAVAEVRSRVSNTAAYSGTVWRAEAPEGVYTSLGPVPFNCGAWGDTPGTGLETNKSYRYVVRADGVTPEASVAGTLVSRFIPNRYSVWMGSSNLLHFVPPAGFLTTGSNPYPVSTVIDRSYVIGAAPLAVYQQQRWNNPLGFAFSNLHAQAAYRLRLHVAETLYSTVGGRYVTIAVNGQTVFQYFDAATFAGAAYRAAAPEFEVQADSQGTLAVTITWWSQNPLLAALEVRAVPLAAAPAGLTAEPGSAKVALSWPPVVGADGYAVYRTAAGGEPQEIGRVGGGAFTDTTGVVGTTYTYAVRATNELGEGPAATAAAVRYPAPKGTMIRVF